MAKLWPSISCTVVAVLRDVNEGRIALPVTPAATMPIPSRLSSDTSVTISRLIRPPSSTVGRKRTDTPNSFSSSVIVLPPPSARCDTGMKILPPALKRPSWPLMAMMVGSASTFTKPSSFCASRVSDRPETVFSAPATALPPVRKLASRL